jgi:hypothetical protein
MADYCQDHKREKQMSMIGVTREVGKVTLYFDNEESAKHFAYAMRVNINAQYGKFGRRNVISEIEKQLGDLLVGKIVGCPTCDDTSPLLECPVCGK